jgi:DNA-binding MarR family transcriptional regulator
VTLGDLAVAERVQPPTLTRIASRLEEEGLVVRRTDTNDRRVTIVQLSRDGRRLLERTRTRRTAYLTQRLRGLEPEDLAILERAAPILERLAGEQA